MEDEYKEITNKEFILALQTIEKALKAAVSALKKLDKRVKRLEKGKNLDGSYN